VAYPTWHKGDLREYDFYRVQGLFGLPAFAVKERGDMRGVSGEGI
jgi:hypothetical protein